MAQKRKRNKSWVYWIVIFVLLIAAGVVAYLVWDNYFNDKKADSNNQETLQEDKKKEKEVEKSKDDEEVVVEKEKVVQYDGEDPNKKDALTGVITYAGVNGNTLMIRVNIDQYLEEGVCGLELRRGGVSVYNKESGIAGGPATATCEGFDVPVEGLGGGNTAIIINLSSGGKTGEIIGEVAL